MINLHVTVSVYPLVLNIGKCLPQFLNPCSYCLDHLISSPVADQVAVAYVLILATVTRDYVTFSSFIL